MQSSAGMLFVAYRHGQAGINHPHDAPTDRVHGGIRSQFERPQPGAIDYDVDAFTQLVH